MFGQEDPMFGQEDPKSRNPVYTAGAGRSVYTCRKREEGRGAPTGRREEGRYTHPG